MNIIAPSPSEILIINSSFRKLWSLFSDEFESMEQFKRLLFMLQQYKKIKFSADHQLNALNFGLAVYFIDKFLNEIHSLPKSKRHITRQLYSEI